MCTLSVHMKDFFQNYFRQGYRNFLENLMFDFFFLSRNRLGGTVSYPESRPTRVTRSKVEGKEEAANEKSNEEEEPKVKPEEEKQSETKTETTKVNSPEAAPAGPSNRLMRKKEERKKFIMKRVVRVRKGE